jgi:hypothetical protein
MEQGNYNNPNPGQQYGQGNPYQFQQGYGMQVDLPNATTVLVLGIISIVFFAGIIGLILSIISLNMASNARAEYASNPGRYTASSLSKVNSGRICSIISLCLLGVVLLVLLVVLLAGM